MEKKCYGPTKECGKRCSSCEYYRPDFLEKDPMPAAHYADNAEFEANREAEMASYPWSRREEFADVWKEAATAWRVASYWARRCAEHEV